MRDSSWMLLIVALGGCGPAVSLGETTTGDSSTGSSDDGSGGLPPSSTVTTGAPPPGSTGDPEACFVGQIRACTCPDGTPGERECGPDRILGPCQCGDASTSGWWGTSSTGGDVPDIPDLPPGEVCLPTTMPCTGEFYAYDDEGVAALGTCSRIQGNVFLQGDVSTLIPLQCLVTVEGLFAVDDTQLVDFSGLRLGVADTFVVANNQQLVVLDPQLLNFAHDMLVTQNPNLMELDFGNLDTVVNLDFTDNPALPDCMITDLIAQTWPDLVNCSGNLASGCADACG